MTDTATARPKGYKTLAEEIAEMDQAAFEAEVGPCEGCASAERCALRSLACVAFSVFVDRGGSRRWKAAPRQPSAEIFARLFR